MPTIRSLYEGLPEWFVVTDQRAPNTKDRGLVWLFIDGTTNRLYTRDAVKNAWRGPTNQS